MHFIYTIRRRDAAAQVVIEGPDAEVNARIFEALEADREKIEAEFGGPLQWERVENRKRCSIGVTLAGGRDDEDRWPEVQRTMIEAMLRLDRTFRPRIQALRV